MSLIAICGSMTGCLVSTQHMVHSTWYTAHGTQHMVHSAWYTAHGTQRMISVHGPADVLLDAGAISRRAVLALCFVATRSTRFV